MKDNIKAFLGFWLVFSIILIWIHGGGRYNYNAHVSLLLTIIGGLVIDIIFVLGVFIYNKFK